MLILGAAALQMPLIKYIKGLGYKVAVVSIPGSYPGFAIADHCIYCDVRDGEAILAQIANENIVAVVTDQTDISVPTVAYLATKLGLKGNCVETAQVYSNKYMMRQACDRIGLSNPKYVRLSSANQAKDWNIYPAIIKPEDNQGSRGVSMVHSYEELSAAVPAALSFSRTGYAILEEFFVGDEVVVEGFVKDGEYINWGIGDRKYFELDNLFIPAQTIFPSNLNDELTTKLLDAEKRLHAYLCPAFGMIHSEYLVNRTTKEIRLVETALRGGGVYISSHLVPLYSGYNNYDLLLNAALGKDVNLLDVEQQMHRQASAYVCFYLPEGEIVSVEGRAELKKMSFVHVADLDDLKVGMHTKPMLNKTMRLGPIIVSGTNRSNVEQHIACVQQTLQIKVKQGDGNIKRIEWK